MTSDPERDGGSSQTGDERGPRRTTLFNQKGGVLLRPGGDGWLSYCMNVHPGESLGELEASLLKAAKVREALGVEEMGVGLWLSANAARALRNEPDGVTRFKERLAKENLKPYTVNAFPYGGFHGETVKRDAFRPDWREMAREDYTVDVANVLAGLLEEDEVGSISTLPVSYKMFSEPKGAIDRLCHMAWRLNKIREEQGREIVLALEPEPFGFLESTHELVEFFKEEILIQGRDMLAATYRLNSLRVEELLFRHLGVCFDTCHFAMQWEKLDESIASLTELGVRIPKAQYSVALELEDPANNPEGIKRLHKFAEQRWLHQVVSWDGRKAEDLSEIFTEEGDLNEEWKSMRAFRVHFHVPIFWKGDDTLKTTRPELDGVSELLLEAGCRHFEVETYSWDVIPEKERAAFGGDLTELIAREIREAAELMPAEVSAG